MKKLKFAGAQIVVLLRPHESGHRPNKRRTRTINLSDKNSKEKIKQFEKKYDGCKIEAERIIKSYCG